MSKPDSIHHPGQLIVQWEKERCSMCKECPPQCAAKCQRPSLLGGATIETAMEAYQTKMMCFLGWLVMNSVRCKLTFKKKVITYSKFKDICPHLKMYYLKKFDPNILVSDLDSCGVSGRTISIIEGEKIRTVEQLMDHDIKQFGMVVGVGKKTMQEITRIVKELEIWKGIKWEY